MIRHIQAKCSLIFERSRLNDLILIAGWLVGICLGMLAAQYTSDILLPIMRMALITPVSFSGLFVAAVVPFLLSILAVSLFRYRLLPLICSAKAFSYGFCARGLLLLYGSSSWLLQLLLMFSNSIITPMQFFFSLRHIHGCRFRSALEPAVWICAIVTIVLLDYYFISPFLVELMS